MCTLRLLVTIRVPRSSYKKILLYVEDNSVHETCKSTVCCKLLAMMVALQFVEGAIYAIPSILW